jgi:hypothetical protein
MYNSNEDAGRDVQFSSNRSSLEARPVRDAPLILWRRLVALSLSYILLGRICYACNPAWLSDYGVSKQSHRSRSTTEKWETRILGHC